MILDSSAIVAIATEEPGCLELLEKLDQADTLAIGAPTLVETALVLRSRLTLEPRAFLERFLTDWNVSVVPCGEHHWKTAVDAHARFGRGHHKAALDFGDCLSYATAKLAVHAASVHGRGLFEDRSRDWLVSVVTGHNRQ